MKVYSKVAMMLMIVFWVSNTTNSAAQAYQPMLGDYNEWYQLYWFEGGDTYLYYTFGDTTLGGKSYKVILSDLAHEPLHPKVVGAIREDVAQRKIYYRDFNTSSTSFDTVEVLLYDFSKGKGDTVWVNTPDDPYVLKAWRIYEEDTNTAFTSHRVMYLHEPGVIDGVRPVWVEGVGSLDHLVYNSLGWGSFNDDRTMVCAFRDSVHTLYGESIYKDFGDTTNDCIMYWSGIASYEITPLNFYPNPSPGYLVVEMDQRSTGTLEIHNHLGQMVYQRQLTINGQEIVQLPEHMESGLYLIHYFNDQGHLSGKLMVER